MSVQILTVCSGNICRSPMAEQILRVQLEPVHGLEVASAGTIGLTGSPMDERAARLAERLGSRDADAHCARALDIEMVRGSNLVFAMAREHRKAVVELLRAPPARLSPFVNLPELLRFSRRRISGTSWKPTTT